jgi:hypothetical protein
MNFPKTPPELVGRFTALVPVGPDVTSRKMFGYPVSFINGNMFMGLHGASMLLRLPEKEREAFIAETGSSIFEPMPGHRMKEYVLVPDSLIGEGIKPWLESSMKYVRGLPPKVKKKKA